MVWVFLATQMRGRRGNTPGLLQLPRGAEMGTQRQVRVAPSGAEAMEPGRGLRRALYWAGQMMVGPDLSPGPLQESDCGCGRVPALLTLLTGPEPSSRGSHFRVPGFPGLCRGPGGRLHVEVEGLPLGPGLLSDLLAGNPYSDVAGRV